MLATDSTLFVWISQTLLGSMRCALPKFLGMRDDKLVCGVCVVWFSFPNKVSDLGITFI